MAKVVSTIFSSMRGSVAGTTYLTTPAGQIIARQRTRPVTSTSPMSTFAKDAMIIAVYSWNALTVAQKTAWNLWATANGTLTGRQEFIAAQAMQNFMDLSGPAGYTPMSYFGTAPDFTGHAAMTLLAQPYVVPATTGVAFQVKNSSAHVQIAFIELSPMLSNGRNYWKGPWDTSVSQGSSLTAGGTKLFTFSGLSVGMRYYARARCFTAGITLGHLGRVISPALITFATAVTNP